METCKLELQLHNFLCGSSQVLSILGEVEHTCVIIIFMLNFLEGVVSHPYKFNAHLPLRLLPMVC